MHTKTVSLILVLQMWTCYIQSAEQPVSALADLAENSQNAAAWILSPLSGTLPSEVRQNLIFLREDLLDEGKAKTDAERVPYRSGYQLCTSLLAALDERDRFAVRAQLRSAQAEAREQPSDRAILARRNYKMSWPQYHRELEQREDLKRQEAGVRTLQKEQAYVEWLERTAILRLALDRQYAAFRKELRNAGFIAVYGKATEALKPTHFSDQESKVNPHSGNPNSVFTNSLGMKFTALPGEPVLICIHETRVRDYNAFMRKNGGQSDTASSQEDDLPITNVSWIDAKEFCQWLSKKELHKYRLPSDREWSLAVGIAQLEDYSDGPESLNGKIKNHYPWGTIWPPPVGSGNYRDNFIPEYNDGWSGLAPVMSFNPNQYGIFDLGGNVSEWCANHNVTTASPAILRGGNFRTGSTASLNSSNRNFFDPIHKAPDYGFRCIIEMEIADAGRDLK